MPTHNTVQWRHWYQDKSNRRTVDHPIVAWIYRRQASKMKDLIPDVVCSILDCGCGNGFFQTFLEEVFQTTCVGIDFSAKMLQINPNKQKIMSVVTLLPFGDKTFDLVTCSMLLHHLTVAQQKIAINEMQRVAKKYIFIVEPNRNNLVNAVFMLWRPEEREGVRFNLKYLRYLCQSPRLEILNTYIDSLLLPNAMPIFLFPTMKKLDKTFLSSWLGFNCNILCRITSVQTQ